MSRLALVVALLAVGFTPAADLQTLSGQKVAGDLARIDAKSIVLETDNGPVSVPVQQALLMNLGGEPAELTEANYIDVELVDGSLIHCSDFKIKGKTVELTLFQAQPGGPTKVTTPFQSVFYIVRNARVTKESEDWKQILANRGNRDILITAREGRLNGVDGTADQGSEDGESLKFRLSIGRDADIKLTRVQGLIFNQPPQGVIAPTVCKITDADGNRYHAKGITYDGQRLELTTVGGLSIGFDKLDHLTTLDFSQGKVTFLSDLKLTDLDEPDTIEFGGSLAYDENLDGEPIRLDGEEFAKGLTVHPRSVLTYNIDGDYAELKMVLGIDDSVITDSHVKVTIDGDGRELYQAEIRRKDEPRPITLNVKDVNTVRIIVESMTLLDLGNQVTLADLKVKK